MTITLTALGALLAMLLLLAGLALYIKRVTAKVQAEINEVMSKLAQTAVERAHDRGVELDFSAASVQGVECLLAKLHESSQAGKLTDDQINEEAMQWGAYVGEVMRRHEGGRWSCNHDVAGANSYPLSHSKGDDFPVLWCGKRIVNGPEESVWDKFRALVRI